jgi:hypothetical protein
MNIHAFGDTDGAKRFQYRNAGARATAKELVEILREQRAE